jgi:small subunit ribosomal protein S9
VANSTDHLGTGRRKTAVARVRIREGSGDILINGREFREFFPRLRDQSDVLEPFKCVEMEGKFDVIVRVRGGGITGQAGAVRLGVSRALVAMDEELRAPLHEAGHLTRDSRMVERKKYGLRGARRGYQFSKR